MNLRIAYILVGTGTPSAEQWWVTELCSSTRVSPIILTTVGGEISINRYMYIYIKFDIELLLYMSAVITDLQYRALIPPTSLADPMGIPLHKCK